MTTTTKNERLSFRTISQYPYIAGINLSSSAPASFRNFATTRQRAKREARRANNRQTRKSIHELSRQRISASGDKSQKASVELSANRPVNVQSVALTAQGAAVPSAAGSPRAAVPSAAGSRRAAVPIAAGSRRAAVPIAAGSRQPARKLRAGFRRNHTERPLLSPQKLTGRS
jgi:hypothetical protein